MKKFFILLLTLIPAFGFSQVHTALFFSTEVVDMGLNVNTQIPFSQDHNVRLHIEGGDLISGAFNVDLFCAIENGEFSWLQSSSSSGALPIDIVAFKKNGKLGLNFVGSYYKLQLNITGYAETAADSTLFQNWSVSVDSNWDNGGTDPIVLQYSNSFGNVFGIGSSYLQNLSTWKLNISKAIRNGTPTGGYYESEGNTYISQNATFDNNTSTWKSIASKSANGSAILLQTLGKNGKALDLSVDTSISNTNEALEFTNLFTVTTTGKTGIGSTDPKEALQVNGNIVTTGPNRGFQFNTYESSGNKKYVATGYAAAFNLDTTGALSYSATTTSGTAGADATLKEAFIIDKEGRVGIGTRTPQARLAINGDVYAKKVKVTATGWPDYVFEPQYTLPDLAEVERFIQKNKHLPGVLSAKEVETEGNDIGETQVRLLKKVEELTLYVIELNKKVTALEKENTHLRKKGTAK